DQLPFADRCERLVRPAHWLATVRPRAGQLQAESAAIADDIDRRIHPAVATGDAVGLRVIERHCRWRRIDEAQLLLQEPALDGTVGEVAAPAVREYDERRLLLRHECQQRLEAVDAAAVPDHLH